MEQIKIIDNPSQEAADMARTMLILSNFEWIKKEAAAIGVSIIPIKGIDLLQTLYANSLARPVRDIDLLCHSEEDLLKLAHRLCLEDYRLEFPFALRPKSLASKKKASLLSCSTTKVNVDLHTAFVTKKFFSQTIGTFNADAINRCRDGHMEATDRWLFLAQHAAFHMYGDFKWTIDLDLLYQQFTEGEKEALSEKATRYGFRRVLAAALSHIAWHRGWMMHEGAPSADAIDSSPLQLTASERRFLRFIRHFDRPFSRKAADRLIAAYWEFTFIDHRSDRLKAWLHLMFPTKGALTNIYRIRHPLAFPLFYPLNILVSGITSAVFWMTYTFISRFGNKKS